jgi:hypothetical protein
MTTNTTSDAGSPRFEPVHDILKGTISRPLDCIFSPKAVALIGATESPNSVGRTVLENLQQGQFAGAIYPINPKREQVLGLKAYPSILAVPGKVDLAVVVTPPDRSRHHPRLRPGRRARGHHHLGRVQGNWARRDWSWSARCWRRRRGQMRIVGPNCLGVMVPGGKLNATFAAGMARPGSRGVHQPERRALHGRPGLEPQGKRRLQRVCFDWFDGGCRLGRLDLSSGRRSRHPQHCHLHGIHRRRPRLPCPPRAKWR